MKLLRHWKLVVGMTAIFGAGTLTGVVLTLQGVKRALTERSALKRWGDARMAEFQRRLELTPEQRKEIRPILDKAGTRFRGIVADAFEETLTQVEITHGEIATHLTPEQNAEFEKIKQDAVRRWRDLSGPKETQGTIP
jgi:Spy/CpxP family protein refolding chaperone